MHKRLNQNWGYYEARWLVEIWADEEIQRQLSAMGKKQNIWENDGHMYKRTASQFTTTHETCLKPTSVMNKNKLPRNMLT